VGVAAPMRTGDDTLTLIVGVSVGAALSLGTLLLLLVVVAWLACRRRRRRLRDHTQPAAGHENTRLEPETADNRLNDSASLPARNNAATSAVRGRYSADGTLVLTVTNDCTGNGSDVITAAAAQCVGDVKKDNHNAAAGKPGAGGSDVITTQCVAHAKKDNYVAASAPPGKCVIGSDDVTRYVTDDVNVWPYGDCVDENEARGSVRGVVHRGAKFRGDDDDYIRRLRRASTDDAGKNRRRKNQPPRRASESTKIDDDRSSTRGEATSDGDARARVVETVSAHVAATQRRDDAVDASHLMATDA